MTQLHKTAAGSTVTTEDAPFALRCVVCRAPFDFASGESAVVLRHVAYGFGFAHEGGCLVAALDSIFPEPGFDGAAFARDRERRRVLSVAPPEGWSAVLPESAEQVVRGTPVRFEPLRFWARVEYRDGSQRLEGVVWDQEWLDEPAAAEFVEARRGRQALVGYASPADMLQPARLAQWRAEVVERYVGAREHGSGEAMHQAA